MDEVVRNINIGFTLMAGFLVFFMNAGFAMVETGFTRAKNSCNIIMKNLVDFSVGSIVFFLIGFGIMFGDSFSGLFGTTGFFAADKMTNVGAFADLTPATFLIFQTFFCATAATIVSGAMAERTKFIAYIIYSAIISVVIYPVVGHWIWGGGWLAELGFVDFAGSTVVHSVGGWSALVGAAVLGPRTGKYINGKSRPIAGHSITLGALGVFILWFGWFGFNPGSAVGVNAEVGHIAMTTNLAAASAALVAMVISWIRLGKPDVGISLNGALAGLVAITAGCQVVTLNGAILIGIGAGVVLVFGVEFIDKVLKVDDPVGAVGVHCLNGIYGTLMVGLFANYQAGDIYGLFYGGGFSLLGVQALGVITVAIWVLITTFILFTGIKKTVGLRVSKEEELQGLDLSEHGMEGYPDFVVKSEK